MINCTSSQHLNRATQCVTTTRTVVSEKCSLPEKTTRSVCRGELKGVFKWPSRPCVPRLRRPSQTRCAKSSHVDDSRISIALRVGFWSAIGIGPATIAIRHCHNTFVLLVWLQSMNPWQQSSHALARGCIRILVWSMNCNFTYGIPVFNIFACYFVFCVRHFYLVSGPLCIHETREPRGAFTKPILIKFSQIKLCFGRTCYQNINRSIMLLWHSNKYYIY